MGLYALAKPSLDYSSTFEEPPGGPRYKMELMRNLAAAEKYKRDNEWKASIFLGIAFVLLTIGMIVRG